MSSGSRRAPPVKSPTDRIAFVFIGIGIAVLGLFAGVSGGVTMTLLGFAIAAPMGFTGVHQLFFGRAAVRTHAALQAITRGLIAFYRGDAATATAVLEAASGARTKLFTRTQEQLLRAYCPLARARLAEAVVLAREGTHDALAAFFREHGSLVLEHSLPRERVLARALRKMVTSRARSVYRVAARPDDGSAETNALGDCSSS